MNAGAYGGEIKDVLYCSKCLKPEIDSLTSSNPIIHFRKNSTNSDIVTARCKASA